MTAPVTRRARRLNRRAAFRRFYLHTGASTVVPGSGLLGTRAALVGFSLVLLFLASLIWVAVRVMSGGVVGTALSIGLSSRALLMFAVVAVLGALVWIGAVLLTSKVTRPERLTSVDRWTVRLFTALCAVLVAIPTTFAVRTLGIQRDLVQTVFSSGPKATSGSHVDPEAEDPWRNTPRVNVMLIGSDSGRDRIGVRSDSMMIASIDTKSGDTLLIGLPRNLDYVPFAPDDPLHTLYPDGFHCIDPATGTNTNCLLNGVWTEAEGHPDLFPDDPTPGYTETRRALGNITGLEINQSVIIDLKGFEQLVDAVGGVEVNVKSRLCMHCKSNGAGGIIWTNGQENWIETGPQHLNGEQALWYARSRAQSDDFDRMRRQRCLVGALINQSNPVSLLANYGQLAAVFKHNVDVDIPASDLSAWSELAQRIQQGSIKSLPVTNQVVNTGRPDYDKIRTLIDEAINPPPKTATAPPTSTGTPTTPPSSTSGGTPTTSPTPTDGLTDLKDAC
ncbi:MAG: LCP family protein [Nostocoides sp.]